MAAALGHNLVFEQYPGGAASRELLHRALHVVQVAVAGIAVGDDRDGYARGHTTNGVGHFAQGDEVQVRQAEQRRAGAETADENGLKPGLLDDQRGEDVMGAQAANNSGQDEQFAESFGAVLRGGSFPAGSAPVRGAGGLQTTDQVREGTVFAQGVRVRAEIAYNLQQTLL